MSSKLTALTESILFGDSDQFYGVIDPGGSPLSRRVQSVTFQRYMPMPQSAITGLGLANNGGDANNDIDIAAGRALAGTGDYNMILTAAKTKQLDAGWAVGTNQGGLDTGSKAINTWYHIWLIARVDTHVVDVLYSASATAPTMPTNYTKKRRIGAVKTDASNNILAFLQYADDFWWKLPPALDIDDATLTTTKKNYALVSVPAGIVVTANINVNLSAAAARTLYFSNPNFTDVAPSNAATPLGQVASTTTLLEVGNVKVMTDTSANISIRSTGASTQIRAAILGWVDPRGKW